MFVLCSLHYSNSNIDIRYLSVALTASKESDVLAAFHAEQVTYLEKKKAAQKRKGEGRDEQVEFSARKH